MGTKNVTNDFWDYFKLLKILFLFEGAQLTPRANPIKQILSWKILNLFKTPTTTLLRSKLMKHNVKEFLTNLPSPF